MPWLLRFDTPKVRWLGEAAGWERSLLEYPKNLVTVNLLYEPEYSLIGRPRGILVDLADRRVGLADPFGQLDELDKGRHQSNQQSDDRKQRTGLQRGVQPVTQQKTDSDCERYRRRFGGSTDCLGHRRTVVFGDLLMHSGPTQIQTMAKCSTEEFTPPNLTVLF